MYFNRIPMILGAAVFLFSTSTFSGENMDSTRAANETESGGVKYRVSEDAAKMIGKDVVNQKGEDVGSIENMLITDTDNVQYAILSVGGFLGLGEKLVAVPLNNLQFDKDKEDVTLKNVTKEDLESAPEFDYAASGIENKRFPQYGADQQ
jgi:sporulation protein YlmC with PRC-barrel domain